MAEELKETDSSLKESDEESDVDLLGFECFKFVNDYTPFKFNEKLISKKPKKYFAFSCCENPTENVNQKNINTNTNSIGDEKVNQKEGNNKINTKKEKNELNRNSYNSYKNLYNQNNGYLGISTDDVREVEEYESEGEGEEGEEVEDEEDFQDFEDELGINKFTIRPDSCVKKAVVNIIETYNKIKPNFYTQVNKEEEHIILTEPSEPTNNNGKDNKNNDLIVSKNDKIKNDKYIYTIIDLLGTGISGQTFKVFCQNDNKFYALKIIKNKDVFTKMSHYEYLIMKKLNENDKKDEYHIIRSYECFKYNNHLCIVNELMQKTLLDILKSNRSKGLSLTSIRFISKQLLKAVEFIHNSNFVHTDLKPENILLSIDNENNTNIIKEKASQNTDLINNKVKTKIADFGSACFRQQLIRKTYIQSLFYRAPEVIMELPLNEKIDVWSLGCILLELYLSTPIMPGTCSYDQLYKINSLIGEIPQYLIQGCKKLNKYFLQVNNKDPPYYRIKTPKEYYKEFPKDKPKDYYSIPENLRNLDELMDVKKDTIKSKNSRLKSLNNSSLSINSSNIRDDLAAFIHLVKGMLQIDPNKRWSCMQCLKHPFITREKLGKLYFFENDINQFMSNSFNYNNKSHIQNNYRSMNKSFNNNFGNPLNYSLGNFKNINFMKNFQNNQRNSIPNNQNFYPTNDNNNKNNNNQIRNNNMNYNYNNMNNYNNLNNQKLNSSFSYNLYQNNFLQNQVMPQYYIMPNYFPGYYNMNNPNNYYRNNNNNSYIKQNKSFLGFPTQNLNSSFNSNQNQNYNLQNFQNFKKNKQYNKNDLYFNKNKNLNTLEEHKEEHNNDNNNK
jgi:serine/threonine protein kinase